MADEGTASFVFTDNIDQVADHIVAGYERIRLETERGIGLNTEAFDALPTELRAVVDESLTQVVRLRETMQTLSEGGPTLGKLHSGNLDELRVSLATMAGRMGIEKADMVRMVDTVAGMLRDVQASERTVARASGVPADRIGRSPATISAANLNAQNQAYLLGEQQRAGGTQDAARALKVSENRKVDAAVTAAVAAADGAISARAGATAAAGSAEAQQRERAANDRAARLAEVRADNETRRASLGTPGAGQFTSRAPVTDNGGRANAADAAAYAATIGRKDAADAEQLRLKRAAEYAKSITDAETDRAARKAAGTTDPTLTIPDARLLSGAGEGPLSAAEAANYMDQAARARLGVLLAKTAAGYGVKGTSNTYADVFKSFGVTPGQVTPDYKVPFAYNPAHIDSSAVTGFDKNGAPQVDADAKARVAAQFEQQLGILRSLTDLTRGQVPQQEQITTALGEQIANAQEGSTAAAELLAAQQRVVEATQKLADEKELQALQAKEATAGQKKAEPSAQTPVGQPTHGVGVVEDANAAHATATARLDTAVSNAEKAANNLERAQNAAAADVKTYFHGTVETGLKAVLPQATHKGRVTFPSDTDPTYAYATSEDSAREYAEKAYHAAGVGVPRVYEVKPVGPVERDPQTDQNGRSRSNYADDVRSKTGFQVIREVPQDHPTGEDGYPASELNYKSPRIGAQTKAANALNKSALALEAAQVDDVVAATAAHAYAQAELLAATAAEELAYASFQAAIDARDRARELAAAHQDQVKAAQETSAAAERTAVAEKETAQAGEQIAAAKKKTVATAGEIVKAFRPNLRDPEAPPVHAGYRIAEDGESGETFTTQRAARAALDTRRSSPTDSLPVPPAPIEQAPTAASATARLNEANQAVEEAAKGLMEAEGSALIQAAAALERAQAELRAASAGEVAANPRSQDTVPAAEPIPAATSVPAAEAVPVTIVANAPEVALPVVAATPAAASTSESGVARLTGLSSEEIRMLGHLHDMFDNFDVKYTGNTAEIPRAHLPALWGNASEQLDVHQDRIAKFPQDPATVARERERAEIVGRLETRLGALLDGTSSQTDVSATSSRPTDHVAAAARLDQASQGAEAVPVAIVASTPEAAPLVAAATPAPVSTSDEPAIARLTRLSADQIGTLQHLHDTFDNFDVKYTGKTAEIPQAHVPALLENITDQKQIHQDNIADFPADPEMLARERRRVEILTRLETRLSALLTSVSTEADVSATTATAAKAIADVSTELATQTQERLDAAPDPAIAERTAVANKEILAASEEIAANLTKKAELKAADLPVHPEVAHPTAATGPHEAAFAAADAQALIDRERIALQEQERRAAAPPPRRQRGAFLYKLGVDVPEAAASPDTTALADANAAHEQALGLHDAEQRLREADERLAAEREVEAVDAVHHEGAQHAPPVDKVGGGDSETLIAEHRLAEAEKALAAETERQTLAAARVGTTRDKYVRAAEPYSSVPPAQREGLGLTLRHAEQEQDVANSRLQQAIEARDIAREGVAADQRRVKAEQEAAAAAERTAAAEKETAQASERAAAEAKKRAAAVSKVEAVPAAEREGRTSPTGGIPSQNAVPGQGAPAEFADNLLTLAEAFDIAGKAKDAFIVNLERLATAFEQVEARTTAAAEVQAKTTRKESASIPESTSSEELAEDGSLDHPRIKTPAEKARSVKANAQAAEEGDEEPGIPLLDANRQVLPRYREVTPGKFIDLQATNPDEQYLQYKKKGGRKQGTGEIVTDLASQYEIQRADLAQTGGISSNRSSQERLDALKELIDPATKEFVTGLRQVAANLIEDTRLAGRTDYLKVSARGVDLVDDPYGQLQGRKASTAQDSRDKRAGMALAKERAQVAADAAAAQAPPGVPVYDPQTRQPLPRYNEFSPGLFKDQQATSPDQEYLKLNKATGLGEVITGLAEQARAQRIDQAKGGGVSSGASSQERFSKLAELLDSNGKLITGLRQLTSTLIEDKRVPGATSYFKVRPDGSTDTVDSDIGRLNAERSASVADARIAREGAGSKRRAEREAAAKPGDVGGTPNIPADLYDKASGELLSRFRNIGKNYVKDELDPAVEAYFRVVGQELKDASDVDKNPGLFAEAQKQNADFGKKAESQAKYTQAFANPNLLNPGFTDIGGGFIREEGDALNGDVRRLFKVIGDTLVDVTKLAGEEGKALKQERGDAGHGSVATGFLSGIFSGGFGGDGTGGLAGLAHSAGTTLKYTSLYSALGILQTTLASVGTQMLNFDDSNTNLALAMDQTAGSTDNATTVNQKYVNSLQDIATVAGANVGDVMDIASSGIRAFGNSADLSKSQIEDLGLTYAREVQKMAILANTTLIDAKGNVSASIAGFGGDIGSASRISDAVAYAKRFGGNEKDISQGVASFAEAANAGGFSPELAAALVAKVQSGSDRGGAAIGTTLSRITGITGGHAAQTALTRVNAELAGQGQFGPQRDVIDVSGTAKSADQLTQLAAVFGHLTAAQQKLATNQIAGTGSAREFAAMMQFLSTTTQTTFNGIDTAGTSAKEVAIRVDTLTGEVNKLRGAFIAVILDIGKSGVLSPLVVGLKVVEVALSQVDKLLQGFQQIPLEIRNVGFAFGELFLAIKAVEKIGLDGGLVAALQKKGIPGLSGRIKTATAQQAAEQAAGAVVTGAAPAVLGLAPANLARLDLLTPLPAGATQERGRPARLDSDQRVQLLSDNRAAQAESRRAAAQARADASSAASDGRQFKSSEFYENRKAALKDAANQYNERQAIRQGALDDSLAAKRLADIAAISAAEADERAKAAGLAVPFGPLGGGPVPGVRPGLERNLPGEVLPPTVIAPKTPPIGLAEPFRPPLGGGPAFGPSPLSSAEPLAAIRANAAAALQATKEFGAAAADGLRNSAATARGVIQDVGTGMVENLRLTALELKTIGAEALLAAQAGGGKALDVAAVAGTTVRDSKFFGAAMGVAGGLIATLTDPITLAIGAFLAIGAIKGKIDGFGDALREGSAATKQYASAGSIDALKASASSSANAAADIRAKGGGFFGTILFGGKAEAQAGVQDQQSQLATDRAKQLTDLAASNANKVALFGDPATRTLDDLATTFGTLDTQGASAQEKLDQFNKALGVTAKVAGASGAGKAGALQAPVLKDSIPFDITQGLPGVEGGLPKLVTLTSPDTHLYGQSVHQLGQEVDNPALGILSNAKNQEGAQAKIKSVLPDTVDPTKGLSAKQKELVVSTGAQYFTDIYNAKIKSQGLELSDAMTGPEFYALVKAQLSGKLDVESVVAGLKPGEKLSADFINSTINTYTVPILQAQLSALTPGDQKGADKAYAAAIAQAKTLLANAAPDADVTNAKQQYAQILAQARQSQIDYNTKLRDAEVAKATTGTQITAIREKYFKINAAAALAGGSIDALVGVLNDATDAEVALLKKTLTDAITIENTKIANDKQIAKAVIDANPAVIALTPIAPPDGAAPNNPEQAAREQQRSHAAQARKKRFETGRATPQDIEELTMQEVGPEPSDARDAKLWFIQYRRQLAANQKLYGTGGQVAKDQAQSATDKSQLDKFNAAEKIRTGDLAAQAKKDAAERTISQRNADANPDNGLDAAGRQLADATTRLGALRKSDAGWWTAYATKVQAQRALAKAVLDAANDSQLLNIDLSNPVATANQDLAAARASEQVIKDQPLKDIAAITDPKTGKVIETAQQVKQAAINKAEVNTRQKELTAQAAANTAFLTTLSDSDKAGRITHAAYMEGLKNEEARVQKRINGMKVGDEGYKQWLDYLHTIQDTERAAANALQGQFNLGDIKVPSVYQVREAVLAKTGGSILKDNASTSTAGNVTNDNSTRNVVLNGVPIQKVMALIEDLFGVKARTNAKRRIP